MNFLIEMFAWLPFPGPAGVPSTRHAPSFLDPLIPIENPFLASLSFLAVPSASFPARESEGGGLFPRDTSCALRRNLRPFFPGE